MRPALVALLLLGSLAHAQDFNANLTPARPQSQPAPQSAAMDAANDALAAQHWEKAIKLLKPLAEASPQDAHILYDLGSAQDALDQSSPAEASYRAAIAANPQYLEPRAALGLLLAREGHLPEARTELAAAAAVPTDNKPVRARVLRALARLDQQAQPSVARDELLAALRISPETLDDTLMAAELAASAHDGGPAAEEAFRKLLVDRPNDPEATAALAHLLMAQKRTDEAEKLLRATLQAHPGDPALSVQLASVLLEEGKSADALPLVETAHAADPENPEVTHMLAVLYLNDKLFDKAEPLLSAQVARNQRDGAVADADARALLELKRFREAEAVLRRVVPDPTLFSTQEEWGSAAFDLAFAASENGEPAVVLQVSAERAKVLPPSPSILFLTAISLDKLHRTKEAVQAYQQFLAASNGALANEEFEARHRLVALQHSR